uniref:Uncharacterized protein n=1 Tax=Arundo donax TaxID=35708 RepID=A0A0A9DIN4_ARUDO
MCFREYLVVYDYGVVDCFKLLQLSFVSVMNLSSGDTIWKGPVLYQPFCVGFWRYCRCGMRSVSGNAST